MADNTTAAMNLILQTSRKLAGQTDPCDKITAAILDVGTSSETREALNHYVNRPCVEAFKLVSSDIAIVVTSRHDGKSFPGVARYNQVDVIVHGMSTSKEWEYVSGLRGVPDNRMLMIRNIGEVRVKEKKGRIEEVDVEMIPPEKYSRWWHTFRI